MADGRPSVRRAIAIGVYGVHTGDAAARAQAERIISEARDGRDPMASVALLKESTFRRELAAASPAPGLREPRSTE